WLQDDFLGFFKEWEAEVNRLEGVEESIKKKMLLSTETTEGLKITVNSFVELTKNLLDLPGVECVLSAKFNQDPLEQYFSKQRGAGATNTNPTTLQFSHNVHSLYVASHCAKASKK
ncbi:uncharacterized protein LOC117105890, partial [Anneissia japonica]|uniref:uncharacterized protein LOC117105890 n=1 Tax=Anneissia japonica TaxID=1529436 RepID=UPI0014255500